MIKFQSRQRYETETSLAKHTAFKFRHPFTCCDTPKKGDPPIPVDDCIDHFPFFSHQQTIQQRIAGNYKGQGVCSGFWVPSSFSPSVAMKALISGRGSSWMSNHGVILLGSRGNMDVLRMLSRPRNSIATRSRPIPPPAWGEQP